MDISELEKTIVSSIQDSTNEVCSTMLELDVCVEKSFVKDEKNIATDLISSLHFFGNKYMGKIAIFTNGKGACGLSGGMLGMEITEVDEDVKDCMGEIVNMIAGGAKTKLEDTFGVLHLLTPWVISGKNLEISSNPESEEGLTIDSQASFSWVMTKFNFGNGSFIVGVQSNGVPESKSYELELEERIKELENENKELKKKTAKKTLKKTAKCTGTAKRTAKAKT